MPIVNRFADFHADIVAWRHDLHEHPELLYDVHRTAATVAERLREFGVDEVTTGIGRTGVVGVIRGRKTDSGRMIGLRADMDALPIAEKTGKPYASTVPGKMHACGHDGHTAMLLGAARYLAETRNFDGTAIVIFQPAEEGGGGGKAMIEDGLIDRWAIQEVYGMHNLPGLPVGTFGMRPGPIMASTDEFTITITGRDGHAARPHMTVDPIVVGAALVNALQTIVSRNVDPLDAAVVSVTRFHAGTAYNVIPETAEIAGTVRCLSGAVRDLAEKRIGAIADSHRRRPRRPRQPVLRPQLSGHPQRPRRRRLRRWHRRPRSPAPPTSPPTRRRCSPARISPTCSNSARAPTSSSATATAPDCTMPATISTTRSSRSAAPTGRGWWKRRCRHEAARFRGRNSAGLRPRVRREIAGTRKRSMALGLKLPKIARDGSLGLINRLLRETGREFAGRYAWAITLSLVIAATTAFNAWLIKDIINKVFFDRNATMLWVLTAVIVTNGFVRGYSLYASSVTLGRIGNAVVARVQGRLFDHMLNLGVDFYNRTPASDLVTRMSHNAMSARQVLDTVINSAGRDFLSLVGLIIVMFIQSPMMSADHPGGRPDLHLRRQQAGQARARRRPCPVLLADPCRLRHAGDRDRHPHRQGLQPRTGHAQAHGRLDRRRARPLRQDRADRRPHQPADGSARRLRHRHDRAVGRLPDHLFRREAGRADVVHRGDCPRLRAGQAARPHADQPRGGAGRRAPDVRASRHAADHQYQPGRPALGITKGEVVFDAVDFAYDEARQPLPRLRFHRRRRPDHGACRPLRRAARAR